MSVLCVCVCVCSLGRGMDADFLNRFDFDPQGHGSVRFTIRFNVDSRAVLVSKPGFKMSKWSTIS